MINSIIFYRYMINNKYINSKKVLLFLLLVNTISINFYSLGHHYILSLLLIASIIDIKERIIPNFLVMNILVFSLFTIDYSIEINFIFVLFFLILLFSISITKNLIGMGDIKLFLALLINLGGENFMTLILILSILLFLTSTFFIIRRSKIKEIPLIPIITYSYIIIGAII